MRRCLVRFANLFRRGRAEGEMTREIEAHLALLREDFERRGLSPREAALAARRAYGGVEQTKELHREARSYLWVEQLFKDVAYGSRNLLRNPGFTLVAAIALALGIGVNATMFGIYNAVALKQLPVADAGRVMRVKRASPFSSRYKFAYTEYQYLRGHNIVFSGVTASSSDIPVLASIAGGPLQEHLNGHAVSATYFADLGVPARIGRTFFTDEDRAPGANTVVVLSYRFWQRRFDGDSKALGQTIKLNGLAYIIVGVAPPEFTGTDSFPTESAFWAPLSMIEQLNPTFGAGWRDQWRDANHPGFEILARLKPGIAPARAQAETDTLVRSYLASYREEPRTTSVTLEKASYFGGAGDVPFQAFAAGVLLIVSLVLLVACANVANMLLARGAARQREIAVRLALGAGRARIIRQMFTETILLSLLGGAAGILFSAWASRLLWAGLTSIVQGARGLRLDLDISPDVHVLAYGLALSVFTGLVSGLAPALQCTRLDLNSAVKEEGAALGARLSRSRLGGLLLGAQVTVSVLLLVVSGGLMGAFVSSFAAAADLGFDTRDTYRIHINNQNAGDTLPRVRQRLEHLPALSGVALGGAPLQESLPLHMAAEGWSGQTQASFASDGYFETLGIGLVRGRGFTPQEADRGASVAVISESAARRLWPDSDPLGKHFSLERMFLKVTDYEVAGIAKDVRFARITETDPSHVYLPYGVMQRLFGGLVVRIRGDRNKALAAVQSAVESVDPQLLPGLDVVSLEDGPIAMQRGLFRVLGAFFGILALLALTLAGVGIYGVMAFLVSQRTREIGIRMALGATSRVVIRSVVMQGLRPVFAGMLVGLVGSVWVVKLVGGLTTARELSLFSRTFSNPALYGELALMLAIAAVASLVPAGRALCVDPVIALRHE